MPVTFESAALTLNMDSGGFRDILSHVLDHADIYTVNAIARSCVYLAAHVRGRARAIAQREVIIDNIGDAHGYVSALVPRLANGIIHGRVRVSEHDGRDWSVFEFDFGIATHWTNRSHIITCGKNGHPYTLVFGDTAGVGIDHCRIDMEFDDGAYICARACGFIEYYDVQADGRHGVTAVHAAPIEDRHEVESHCRKIRTDAIPRGYFVDGHIMPEVIGPWMEKIVALLGWSDKRRSPHFIYMPSDDLADVRDFVSLHFDTVKPTRAGW